MFLYFVIQLDDTLLLWAVYERTLALGGRWSEALPNPLGPLRLYDLGS